MTFDHLRGELPWIDTLLNHVRDKEFLAAQEFVTALRPATGPNRSW